MLELLNLLLNHKEFIVILLLLGFLGFGFMYIKVLHAENAALKTDNATLTSNLKTSNDSITRLQGTITDQNTEINKWKIAAQEREAANAAAIAAAQKQAQQWQQHAENILKMKPDNTDKCKAANDLIDQEILQNAKK